MPCVCVFVCVCVCECVCVLAGVFICSGSRRVQLSFSAVLLSGCHAHWPRPAALERTDLDGQTPITKKYISRLSQIGHSSAHLLILFITDSDVICSDIFNILQQNKSIKELRAKCVLNKTCSLDCCKIDNPVISNIKETPCQALFHVSKNRLGLEVSVHKLRL